MKDNLLEKNNFTWYWLPILISSVLFFIIYYTHTNSKLFSLINQIPGVSPPIFWKITTNFGNGLWVSVLLFLFTWKKPELLWKWLIVALIVTLVIKTLKPAFNYPRPFSVFQLDKIFQFGHKLPSAAFPSGHTATIFAYISLLIFSGVKTTITKYLLIFGAFLVGISRVIVGVHWPLDIIAGAGFGWFAGILGTKLGELGRLMNNKYIIILLSCFLAGVCIFLIFFYNSGYGMLVLSIQRLIGIVCLGASYFTFRNQINRFYQKN